MNKRMEHCLYQAGLTAQGCWEDLDTYTQEGIEKFAELIVKECLAIIQTEVSMKYKDGWEQHGVSDDWAAGHYNASLESRVFLKTHFGVEE